MIEMTHYHHSAYFTPVEELVHFPYEVLGSDFLRLE